MPSAPFGKHSTTRNPWFDQLRGIAIVGVVSVHSIQVSDNSVLGEKSDFFYNTISLGRYGVELFFFLSGCLLASIYGMNDNLLGKPYWFRRLARIYPLWVLFLIIGITRWTLEGNENLDSQLAQIKGQSLFLHSTPGVLILGLTFTLFISASLWTSVIPGSWSIQAEVAHYLIFPFMRRRPINFALNVMSVVNALTAIAFFVRPKMSELPILVILCMDAWLRLGIYSTFGFFLLGIISFLVSKEFRNSHNLRISLTSLEISPQSSVCFSLSFLLVPCPFGDQIEAIGFLVFSFVLSYGIMQVEKLAKLFQFFGYYSYFIYFIHFLALDLIAWMASGAKPFTNFIGAQQAMFVIVLSTALLLSTLLAIPSMKYYEKPIMRWAHKKV